MESEGTGMLLEVHGTRVSCFSNGISGAARGRGLCSSAPRSSHVDPRRRPRLELTGSSFLALLVIWTLVLGWKIFQGQTNLWPVVYGWAFFETINKVLSYIVSLEPRFIAGLQPKNVDSFLNTAVSLLHSTSISSAVIVLLIEEGRKEGLAQMWRHEVLTQYAWPGAHTVLAVSCGYFAYDQWDMLRRRLYKPTAPSVLTHHQVLLTCFIVALFKESCINYLILTLVCELHSIFLHIRKVTLLAGVERPWGLLLRTEWFFNWVTFFTARCAVHIMITVKLAQDRRKFVKGTVELPLASVGMLGLNVLNFILGQGLWRAYRRERAGTRDSVKVAEE